MTEPRPLPLFWRLLEAWFQRVYRMEPLTSDPSCLFAFNLFQHHGPEVRLQCGAVIREGDTLLEIHFRREALLPLIQTGDAARMGLDLIKLGDRDIPRLAEALEQDPRLQSVRAVHALTLFHRGIGRYGFEVLPVRERHVERWFTWWHRLLMARDHAHGSARVKEHLDTLVTRHVWLSREELIRGYGVNGAKRRRKRESAGGWASRT
ncbi:MAG: polysaccharide deacetylase [Armatimonadetes bacterium]|nr:polysaccharide deacetylase [Armatimonadota bacterium]